MSGTIVKPILKKGISEMNYQRCIRCVMDTSDPLITFDKKGECSHCKNFDDNLSKKWFPNDKGKVILNQIIDKIKKEGKGKEYDCIIGLSGGLDSSYLAYKASQYGLRILAVHVDAGWNSELAVSNIESIVKKCGIDLYTHVVDWEIMKDLHASFFKAEVPNQDIPQDHAYFAALYNFATANNIEYVLHGSNISTESVLPKSWGYNNMDTKHIKSIHKKFGKIKLENYPLVNFFKLRLYYPYVKKMKVVKPLNYMPYTVEEALATLTREVNYKYYGGKHFESRFTKFFQAHYLPKKFGFDKRKAHLSSLILSNQITRNKALEVLKETLYAPIELKEDQEYFIKKIGISEEEFEKIANRPGRAHDEYESNKWLFKNFAILEKKVKYFIPKKLRPSN